MTKEIKPALTSEYVNFMFEEFLSVTVKPEGLKHSLYITGSTGCGKLHALTSILKKKEQDHIIYNVSTGFTSVKENLNKKAIIVIDDLSSEDIDKPDIAEELKKIMEQKNIIIVATEFGSEKDRGYNFKSVIDRCYSFHYPQLEYEKEK